MSGRLKTERLTNKHSCMTLLQHASLICITLHLGQSQANSNIYHKTEPLQEFSHHQQVVPQLFPPLIQNLNKGHSIYEKDLKISLIAFNKSFDLELTRNEELIANNYFERHDNNGSPVISTPHSNATDHCHYRGKIANRTNSWVAISICSRLISGIFSDGQELYHIHPNENSSSVYVFKDSDRISEFKCGFTNQSLPKMRTNRSKRSIPDAYNSDSTSRYLELLIVNDYQVFSGNNKRRDLVFERTKRIANIVNALYNQLNIIVVLVGVVIWSERDEIALSSDGDKTLNNFLRYRRDHLIREHMHDNAQLITGWSFSGGVVGKALKQSICTFEYSGGVNTDRSNVTSIVATTLAHELGHNFGMDHDQAWCTCPDQRCIMSSWSTDVTPKHWSSCSRDALHQSFKQGMDYCLHNKPFNLVGPVCGNGIVDTGEQCDCGLKKSCDTKCCNATTCQLIPGAECAVGSCCDKHLCRVVAKEEQIACRPAKSSCDVTEYCDGVSEFCPNDVKIKDGSPCLKGSAFCYDGRCGSRKAQCRLLWGSTAEVSNEKCYHQNTKGTINGNCGYFKQNKSYVSCESRDATCGRLHCSTQSDQLKFGSESAAILARSYLHGNDGQILTCCSASIDLGIEETDPGMVPSGAKCGQDLMCVNQKCVSVAPFLQIDVCPNNCSDNGLCDQKGRCHCHSGYAGERCDQEVVSSVKIALYVVLLVILPLALVLTFVAFKYNEAIKTWWFIQVRKSVIKRRARNIARHKPLRPPSNFNLQTMDISSPMPLDDTQMQALLSPKETNSSIRTTRSKRLEISTPNETQTESLLRPKRPAPPPPPHPGSSHSSLSRSSSRSSKRSSLPRPSQPPPRPPLSHNSNQANSSAKVATVRPMDVPQVKADNKTFPPLPNTKPTNTSRFKTNAKQSSVAGLAKKFDNTRR